ncbi:hypothetical protein FB451DRAFT_681923 [Mycena latifolia]|nr:hypothetical protein FB451DRAFT_681923 [Mycena latifolia]
MSLLATLPVSNVEQALDFTVDDTPLDSILAELDACSVDLSHLALLSSYDISSPPPSSLAALANMDDLVSECMHRPPATAPYSMGLSFTTSGWRAPAWRSPECLEIENSFINPALLLTNGKDMDRVPSAAVQSTALEEDAPECSHQYDDAGDESESDDEGHDAKDPDFEDHPRPKPTSRTIRPLPGRVSPSRRASHPSRAVTKSAPRPSSRRVSPASPAVPSLLPAPSTTSLGSKKRKAARVSDPRSTKKAAITPSASTLPSVAVAFPTKYQYLLDKGCTLFGRRGMRCNVNGCPQTTGNFADMDRHMLHHFPEPFTCLGCPATFARIDSSNRHHKDKKPTHYSAARQSYLHTFNALPEVVRLRELALQDEAEKVKLRHTITPMFEKMFAASQAKARKA